MFYYDSYYFTHKNCNEQKKNNWLSALYKVIQYNNRIVSKYSVIKTITSKRVNLMQGKSSKYISLVFLFYTKGVKSFC